MALESTTPTQQEERSMKALKIVALCLLGSSTLSTFGTAQAAGLPSAEEVRKVMDYYYNGVDGAPVLVDFKLCQNIHREGVEKNNCQDEIHPDTCNCRRKCLRLDELYGSEK